MILLFGASLADSAATRSTITELTGEEVEKHTAPGKPITGWTPLVPPAGSRPGSTAFVIEAGGNGVPSREQVQAADQKLRQMGATKVVWATFADWPDESRAAVARRQTRDVIRSAGVTTVTLPKPPLDKLAGDRVHFTVDGYRDLGALLVAGLRQAQAAQGGAVGLVIFAALLGVTGWVFWKTAK